MTRSQKPSTMRGLRLFATLIGKSIGRPGHHHAVVFILSAPLFWAEPGYAAAVTIKSRFAEISGNSRILPAKSKPGHIPPVKLDQDTAAFKSTRNRNSGGDREPKTPDESHRH